MYQHSRRRVNDNFESRERNWRGEINLSGRAQPAKKDVYAMDRRKLDEPPAEKEKRKGLNEFIRVNGSSMQIAAK